jgi:hypothetical protein
MAEKFMDAALAMLPNQACFFIADQYVVYDYAAAPERVKDGVHSVDSFPPGSATGIPGALFQPNRIITAALPGKGGYTGALYFFSGPRYVRYDEGLNTFAAGVRDTAPAWNLPAAAADPDGCFNGAKNRKAFCYFFKGAQYWRYIWANDAVSGGYPKPISTLLNMPVGLHAGIDAAVDGVASAGSENFDAGYLFKDDKYTRFDWVNDGEGEPHAGALRDTGDGWPGLLELLAAARAKSEALTMVARAVDLTTRKTLGTLSAAEATLVDAALDVHFKSSSAATAATALAGLATIATTLNQSATLFHYRTHDEAMADEHRPPGEAPSAAYTFGIGSSPAWPLGAIMFTRQYLARSPSNRVLSLIHEAVHIFDAASGTPANHIPEWWVSPGARAGFGLPAVINFAGAAPPTFYDTQPGAAAAHNPASFAAYASHVATGSDVRALP